jgi:hypothetical protein
MTQNIVAWDTTPLSQQGSEGAPLYGRKWSITIAMPPPTGSTQAPALVVSSSDFEPGALRVVFKCEKFFWSTLWFGEVEIYNLNPPTQNTVLTQGMAVQLQAGYVNGNYGQIFTGNLFQPLWDRENVVDFKTILHIIDGLGMLDQKITNLTQQAGYDYPAFIASLAANAQIETGGLMNMGGKTFPRGRSAFGTPDKFLKEITRDLNAQYWIGDGQLNVGSIDDESATDPNDALVITPATGLVGQPQSILVATPQLNQSGVSFRTLLNPGITIKKPPNLMMVKLDNSAVRLQKAQIGEMPTLPDQDGIYKVIGVRHWGDTRGNDWYTDVTAVNRTGNIANMGATTQNG